MIKRGYSIPTGLLLHAEGGGRREAIQPVPQSFGSNEFEVLRRSVHVSCPNGYRRTKRTNIFFLTGLGPTATR